MTETEWLAATKPEPMLKFLKGRLSARKLRLFACACARRIWQLFADPRALAAVETAERYADGGATVDELTAAWQAGRATSPNDVVDVATRLAMTLARVVEAVAQPHSTMKLPAMIAAKDSLSAQMLSGVAVYRAVPHAVWAEDRAAANRAQASLLRCIVGFRESVPLAPEWLAWHGGVIVQLARAAYDERRLPEGILNLSRLALLADGLEDASCGDVDLLAHLRSPGPHVRGCHAVDLVLGKQ
jgi:hypothetical protein